ncbi:MAG: sulfatase [Verrucomicrobiae bacterium]|nr:sulfatase [Verrucomicrobiae bacterium]
MHVLAMRVWVFSVLFPVLLPVWVAAATPPNVVILFADDLGYGDVGCYGARDIATPHLDRLAAEGVRFTRFYVSQPVCSASRASLLTGCYANRVSVHGALGPRSAVGLHPQETTLAEVLKARGYATALLGKWHLGDRPEFLPTRQGFEVYFGLPYSNDMWPYHPDYVNLPPEQARRKAGYPDLPLYENERIRVAPVTAEHQAQLTTWYTERAVGFIEQNRRRPFFLYVAYAMPHVPLYVSERFKGRSGRGLYGDVIVEIDWSVGEILGALRRHGLEGRTLVIFSSDNGPWLSYGNHSGSAGPLREGKGTVWEGGVRVPGLMRWPGRIPAGQVCTQPAMTLDLLPTIARLAGAALPTNKIDGQDIWPLMAGHPGAVSPHEAYYFYYQQNELQAVMSGPWKLILPHTYRTMQGQAPGRDGRPGTYRMVKVERPELYQVDEDPGETRDWAAERPDVVTRLLALAERARAELGDALTGRQGAGVRPAGRVAAAAAAP